MPRTKIYNYYHGTIAEPRFVGGDDLDLRDFKLEAKHLTQEDKSLNKRIWSYHPVDRMIDLAPTPMPECLEIEGPPYDLEKVAEYAKHDEFRRSELRAEILLFNYTKLARLRALPFLLRLVDRKRRDQVAPLGDVVKRVSAKKQEANYLYVKGEYHAALIGYFECLLDMMPWFACPLYLTSQQCFDSGLAELEASLWNNACISAAKSPVLTEEETFALTSICGGHVIEMRYVPTKHMYKSQIREIEFVKERLRSGFPVPPELAEPVRLQLLEECVPETKDKTSDAWMHRHCITEHVCYSDRMIAKLRASGAQATNRDIPSLSI